MQSGEIDWWSAYPLPQPNAGSHVRVNFVSSADGAATTKGRSGGLGGENDRALMKVLRTLSDVVMVGAGTVRSEGYGGLSLPDSLLQRRQKLGLSELPRIAIVSRSLDLSPEMSVFTKAENRPLVITQASAPHARREQLEGVADVLLCGDTDVDFRDALKQLAALGLSRVLCEGGPHLFGSLLEADLADEVCLTISPLFVAGTEPRISHSAAAHPRKFQVASLISDDADFVFLRYARSGAIGDFASHNG